MSKKCYRFFGGLLTVQKNWLNKMAEKGYRLIRTGKLLYEFEKCSSGGEAVVRKNNGSYTVGFWYTQGFLDSGFSLFAYSNDDSRTDVIQMVKEYGGIEYEINLSEKEKGWYYVTAKVGE